MASDLFEKLRDASTDAIALAYGEDIGAVRHGPVEVCDVCEGEKRVPGTGGDPCPVCLPDGLAADMTDDQLRAFAARIAEHPAVADVVLTITEPQAREADSVRIFTSHGEITPLETTVTERPEGGFDVAFTVEDPMMHVPPRVDFTTVYGQALYDGLDPGIVDTVRFLHENGFDTCDSGDGRHKFSSPAWQVDGQVPDEVLDFPHVAIRVNPDRMIGDADRLAGLLEGIGLKLIPFGHAGPALVASYDPADPGNAVLFLSDVELVRRPRS